MHATVHVTKELAMVEELLHSFCCFECNSLFAIAARVKGVPIRETLCESGRWIDALKKRGRVLKKRGRVLKKRGRFLRRGV